MAFTPEIAHKCPFGGLPTFAPGRHNVEFAHPLAALIAPDTPPYHSTFGRQAYIKVWESTDFVGVRLVFWLGSRLSRRRQRSAGRRDHEWWRPAALFRRRETGRSRGVSGG